MFFNYADYPERFIIFGDGLEITAVDTQPGCLYVNKVNGEIRLYMTDLGGTPREIALRGEDWEGSSILGVPLFTATSFVSSPTTPAIITAAPAVEK